MFHHKFVLILGNCNWAFTMGQLSQSLCVAELLCRFSWERFIYKGTMFFMKLKNEMLLFFSLREASACLSGGSGYPLVEQQADVERRGGGSIMRWGKGLLHASKQIQEKRVGMLEHPTPWYYRTRIKGFMADAAIGKELGQKRKVREGQFLFSFTRQAK